MVRFSIICNEEKWQKQKCNIQTHIHFLVQTMEVYKEKNATNCLIKPPTLSMLHLVQTASDQKNAPKNQREKKQRL